MMTTDQTTLARHCAEAAERGTMSFPEILGTLGRAGFDGYAVDFRARRATYYPAAGDTIDVALAPPAEAVAPTFRPDLLRAAIRDAQTSAPGYTYHGFCARAAAAGCAGYLVSLPGRRVVYVAASGETHEERFPS
jgi:uncharacterized protein YbcV (DUF1398 family)